MISQTMRPGRKELASLLLSVLPIAGCIGYAFSTQNEAGPNRYSESQQNTVDNKLIVSERHSVNGNGFSIEIEESHYGGEEPSFGFRGKQGSDEFYVQTKRDGTVGHITIYGLEGTYTVSRDEQGNLKSTNGSGIERAKDIVNSINESINSRNIKLNGGSYNASL